MSYSFEALGIDVTAMVQDICNHKLLWYSRNNLPLYTTVVAGLLTNNYFDINEYVFGLQSQK